MNEKPKKYYSLNLTEGRIFIIFVSLIILIAIIVFLAVVVFKITTKNNNTLNSDMNNEETVDDYHTYYEEYSEYSEEIPEMNNDVNEENSHEENNNTQLEEINNEVNNEDNNDNIVEVDNSDVLYSSEYIDEKENRNTDDKKFYSEKKSVKSNNYTEKKDTNKVSKTETKNQNTSYKKRYIVQIGSYKSKSTAEDISIYYQMQGYPVFIKEKENDGTVFYRLRVGPFKEKERAENYLTSLKKSKFGGQSYISIIYL